MVPDPLPCQAEEMSPTFVCSCRYVGKSSMKRVIYSNATLMVSFTICLVRGTSSRVNHAAVGDFSAQLAICQSDLELRLQRTGAICFKCLSSFS